MNQNTIGKRSKKIKSKPPISVYSIIEDYRKYYVRISRSWKHRRVYIYLYTIHGDKVATFRIILNGGLGENLQLR